jgi:hypothetical protein
LQVTLHFLAFRAHKRKRQLYHGGMTHYTSELVLRTIYILVVLLLLFLIRYNIETISHTPR